MPATVTLPNPKQGFRLVPCPYGTLILPTNTKSVWTIDERKYRSLLVDDQGRVLSCGWPKFGNLGEPGFEDADEELRTFSGKNGPVWLSDKLDGTLIIRSVIAGKVVWRTRGHWQLNAFEKPVMVLVAQHPLLSNPAWQAESSLLFEFTSADPALRIVLAHEKDSLTLLGAVDHSTLAVLWKDELDTISRQCDLPLVESIDLEGSWKDWKKTVRQWAGREGIVARTPNGQMVKLKSDAYITLHRLKMQFNTRAVKRMILNEDLHTRKQFEDHLIRLGADWETLSDVKPVIEAAVAARQTAAETFAELENAVDLLCISLPGKRAQQVAAICEYDHAQRQTALLLLDGRYKEAQNAYSRILLEEALDRFEDD